jgi:uncharacterized protein with von Willebrand factor type A (vWA) domain
MTAAGTAPAGEFVRNLMIFVRLLREAGLRVGPERALLATEALAIVGLDHREDVRSALEGVLVDAPEHRPVFDALFEAIFQPGLLEQALLGRAGEAVPGAASRAAPHMPAGGDQDDGSSAMRFASNQRVAKALASLRAERSAAAATAPAQARERAGGYTRDEQLRSSDFRSMTVEEFSEAAERAAVLARNLPEERTRRYRLAHRGTPDLRASLRRAARSPLAIQWVGREPRWRPQSLVLLLDVSGSMQRYARLMLHWAHALTVADSRTETLALGTRLTRISRRLRHRDPDEAVRSTLAEIVDWGGGTRLGSCLASFNTLWARRLLGSRTTVLLLTDGLDREDTALLAREAARLRRHARRVIWLNPLLRYEGFEPRAAGVRALLPSVDAMLPVHNLTSLAKLPKALA